MVVIPLFGDEATGNVTVADVLERKTFSNSSATGLTGTRPPSSVSKTGQINSNKQETMVSYKRVSIGQILVLRTM